MVDTENAFYYDAAKLYLACSIGLCEVIGFSEEPSEIAVFTFFILLDKSVFDCSIGQARSSRTLNWHY